MAVFLRNFINTMFKRALIVLLFLGFGFAGKSQDLIYLNNGSKFEAKVKEITPTEIKYKNVNNPDGPTYVVTKADVLHIEYQNGEVEIINKNPQSVSPQSSTPTAGEQPKPKTNDLYYMNKNALYLNGLALTNADITFLYERDFANNHLSAYVLGGYNFNKESLLLNLNLQNLGTTKKNYDVGIGINYLPSARKKAQYFVGIMMKYMSFNYDREITVQENIGGFLYDKIEVQKAQGYQLATMVVNGFQVRITPNFTYKAMVGIGGFTGNSDLMNNANVLPIKMYLGICFGYRF